MPEYRVLASAPFTIEGSALTVVDGDGRIFTLKVKGLMDGRPLVREQILVKTTNREIIPQDIYVPRYEVETPPLEIPEPPEFDEDE